MYYLLTKSRPEWMINQHFIYRVNWRINKSINNNNFQIIEMKLLRNSSILKYENSDEYLFYTPQVTKSNLSNKRKI